MSNKIIGCVSIAIGGPGKATACAYIFEGGNRPPRVITGELRDTVEGAIYDAMRLSRTVEAEVARLQEVGDKAGPAVPDVGRGRACCGSA